MARAALPDEYFEVTVVMGVGIWRQMATPDTLITVIRHGLTLSPYEEIIVRKLHDTAL